MEYPHLVVSASHLCKTFSAALANQPVHALSDLTLSVYDGQMTALIGPDGAGKTTLIRLFCGLMAPTSGSLSVLGLDTTTHAQDIQAAISYMPQRFGLYENLSVQENLDLYADLHGVPQAIRKKRFAELLDMTALAPFTARLAGNLSGGMKQKLGLVCTLVRTPQLLLLDEPTAGVDPLSRRELWHILQHLVTEEHISVIVSTSYMEEAARCQQIFLLHQGRILTSGAPKDLLSCARHRCFSVKPPTAIPARLLQSLLLQDKDKVWDAVPEGGRVRFCVRSTQSIPNLTIFQQFPNLTVTPERERLEDSVMIQLRQADEATGTESIPMPSTTIGLNKNAPIDIEVRSLCRRFGHFTAVADTSFSVHRGEIFGLLGPNGAGKSTTFRMLCGLLPASSGYLSVAGVDLRHSRSQARAKVGYVAQKFSLYATLSVQENLEFFGRAYGLRGKKLHDRISAVVDQLGLHQRFHQTAGDLPNGYKQRLSMAAALLHKPRILFLDEPTSGIDPLARRTFWQQITALAASGTTVIITTHFMEEAEYCDHILIQDQGRMIAFGTPEEIRRCGYGHSMNDAFIHIVEEMRRNEVTS